MNTETAQTLTISYNTALDCLVSADSAGPRPGKTEADNRKEGGNPWRETVRKETSPFQQADLDLIFAPVSTVIYLFHLVINNEIQEPDELITQLKEMPDRAFLAGFKKFLKIPPAQEDWITPETIEATLEQDRAEEITPFRQEAELLAGLLADITTFRIKTAEVLSWYTEKIFAPRRDQQRETVENWIKKKAPLFEKDRVAALNKLSKDNYDTLLAGVSELHLFPVSGSFNSDLWLLLPGNALLIFSLRYAEECFSSDFNGYRGSEATDLFLEAVGDPKRVAILRLLRQRPHYGRELARELGISASTASYHIEKLVSARLARLQISSGRRFYYAINTGGFEDFLNHLREEFLEKNITAAPKGRRPPKDPV